MERKNNITLAIIIIMVLLNIVGTITLVAVNLTNGRDLVAECLSCIWPTPPVYQEMQEVEDGTLPTTHQTEEIVPTTIDQNTIETIEPAIEPETQESEEMIVQNEQENVVVENETEPVVTEQTTPIVENTEPLDAVG